MRPVLLIALVVGAACQDSDVSRAVGARCDVASDCDDQCLPPSADWPGGFCTLGCDRDEDCPEQTACIEDSGDGVCAFTCMTDRHCDFLGAGYACKERDANDLMTKRLVCRGT